MRRRHQIAAPALLLAGLCLISAGIYGFPADAAERSWSQARQAQPATGGFAGVIGEVARSGTYELGGPSDSLQALLQRAGGLTESASGNVRIIRRGRPGQHVFLRPEVDYTIFPDDVIVVGSRHRQGIGTGVAPRRPRSLAGKPGEPVKLAFVQLVSRPVVLRMRPDDATPARIVALLGQSPELARHLRFVSPSGRAVRQVSHIPPVDQPLSDGTVVIFPPSGVDVSRIPPLPAARKLNAHPAVPAEVASATQASVVPPAHPETVVSPQPGSTRTAAEAESQTETYAGPQLAGPVLSNVVQAAGENGPVSRGSRESEVEVLDGPPQDLGASAIISEGSGEAPSVGETAGLRRMLAPRAGTAPESAGGTQYAGTPAPGRPGIEHVADPALAGVVGGGADWLTRVTPADPGRAASPNTDTLAANAGGEAAAETEDRSSAGPGDLEDESPVEASAWSASTVVILTFGTLLALGTFIVLWSMASQTETVGQGAAEETVAIPLTRDAALEALIQNRLPLTVEPVELPETLEFYGRPQGTLKLRLDAAHEPAARGPRFASRSAAGSGKATSTGERSSAVAESKTATAPASTAPAVAAVAGHVPEADITPGSASNSPSNGAGETRYRADSAEPSSPRRPAVSRSRSRRAGLLDRVLATVHGAEPQ